MDVFYYWKCYEVDIKEKWLNRFVVDTKTMGTKLDEIKKAKPDFIWVFKIPPGCGKNASRTEPQLQLLARLVWSEKEIPRFPKSIRTGECLHYDSEHPGSIVYTNTNNLTAIRDVTKVLKDGGLPGFSNNFQGLHGTHPLIGKSLVDLKNEAAKYSHRPFWSLSSSVLYNSPGNKRDCYPKK